MRSDSRAASPLSSLQSDAENPLAVSACDICHARKVRCDRRDPCGNCKDSKTVCLRERQKRQRKPREQKLGDSLQEIKSRIATIERSVANLVNSTKHHEGPPRGGKDEVHVTSTPTLVAPDDCTPLDTPSNSDAHNATRKRDRSTAFGRANVPLPVSSSHPSPSVVHEQYSTPAFSATEAQNLIRKELDQGARLSKEKRDAFQSALNSLSESLNTTHDEAASLEATPPRVEILSPEDYALPSIEVVQWLLQPPLTGPLGWSIPDAIPLVSRNTIVQMALELQNTTKPRHDFASIAVLCSCAAHFLLGRVLLETEPMTGLEGNISDKITQYFATARAAISQISITAPPNLRTLQALMFGAFNAQEEGDPTASWTFNSAASNMCMSLRLHEKVNPFVDGPPDSYLESRICFFLCYLNDKGLAMNLGRPPCIPDAHIEVDLHDVPLESNGIWQSFYIYLDFGIIQSSILELQAIKSKLQPSEIQRQVSSILQKMDNAWELIQKIPAQSTPEAVGVDSELDPIMAEFAFHSIKTVFHHSGIEITSPFNQAEACLESARASLIAVKKLHDTTTERKYSAYRKHTYAHWTVLYYPFTPFFVLFCNIISKKNTADFSLIQNFVQLLADTKASSPAIQKLYKLCLPFCALASSVLNATDESGKQPMKRPAKRRVLASDAQETTTGDPFVPSNLHGGEPITSTHLGSPLVPEQVMNAITDPPNDSSFNFIDNEFFSQFMDSQPRLQWLDSDFTAFEETWGYSGLWLGQGGGGYPRFQ